MRRLIVVLGALAVLASLAVAAPASADTTQVSGTQSYVSEGVAAMTGDLTGVWYTTGFDFRFHDGGSTLQATGTELFIGCANGSCGWLEFEFNYSAKFDPSSGQLAPGRCYHRIVDGGGDFAGATGSLTMKDRLDGGVLTTTYKGHVKLP